MMQNYETVAGTRQKLENQCCEKGLEATLTDYLSQLAEGFPEGRFPNGLGAADTVRIILDTAQAYVTTRDQQQAEGQIWTHQQVREAIGKNLEMLSQEQAVDYLARLQLVYKYFRPEAAENVTAETLEAEYETLKAQILGRPRQAQIDRLVDSLDVAQVDRYFGYLDEAYRQVENDSDISQMVQQLQAEYQSFETAAICGAVLYAEVAQGNVEGVAPETDPGQVTAMAAAQADAAAVAIKQEKGELTEQAAEEQLGAIGRALAYGLAQAVIGLVFVGGLVLAGLAILYLTGAGILGFLLDAVIWAAYTCGVIYSLVRYEDIYRWFCRRLLKWEKRSGSTTMAAANWRRVKTNQYA